MNQMPKHVPTKESLGRGKRLKIARNLLRVTSEEFCDCSYLAKRTYNGWEQARFNGLTKKGADKIIDRFFELGLVVEESWLWDNVGNPPFLDMREKVSKDALHISKQEEQILKELALFKTQKGCLDLKVTDDDMAPEFLTGDYVAGIQVKNPTSAVGKECIVQLDTGELVLRRLEQGSSDNKFILMAANDSASNRIMADVMINVAAPVLWKRRAYQESS